MGLRSDLEQVEYSSRFCLGLFYSVSQADQVKLPGDNFGAMYIRNGNVPFCFIAVDTIRRGASPGSGFLFCLTYIECSYNFKY